MAGIADNVAVILYMMDSDEQVAFPVVLGNLADANDGVLCVRFLYIIRIQFDNFSVLAIFHDSFLFFAL